MPIQSILQQDSKPLSGSDDQPVPILPGGLDNYEQGQAIGKGGYAVVYRGKRKSDGLFVAIKRVDIANMAPKKRDRCIKEVHLLQQLNHPHIITMYDAFIDQNQLIIVTEWAPGGDLKKLIRRMADAGKRFEELEIWQYFLQIVDGLRGLHDSRILHRDMKPANVLVCGGGVLKLGDLGLGRKLGPQTIDVMSKVGTPYYVSPEVVKGVKYDFKSDMWSTGCLLFELAMLKSPFETEGANLADVFGRISKGDYQPLPADKFSPALRSMVNSLLAQDPIARPSAEQVLQQGQHILQQLAQQQTQQPQQQRPGSGPRAQTPQDQRQQQLRRQTDSVNRRQQDAHSGDAALMSEHLVSTLVVIAKETSCSSSSSTASTTQQSSRRAQPASITAASEVQQLMRHLHPLYFAQPLTAFSKGRGSHLPRVLQDEQTQQLQLGVVVQVASWLARLRHKVEAAQALENELTTTIQAPHSGTRASSNIYRPCKDCLRAAEAVKRAAVAVGVQGLDAVSAVEVSTGYGRALCIVLQGMADAVFRQLQLVCRPPKAYVAVDLYMEEMLDDEQDAEADIAAAAAAAVNADAVEASADIEQDTAYGSILQSHNAGAVQVSVGVACKAAIQSQVDVAAWRAEVERLGPQLARIHIPAATAAQPGLTQEWLSRWQSTKQLQQQMAGLVQQVSSSLPHVQQQVAGDVERLGQTEDRLNRQLAESLGHYAGLRQQVDQVVQQRQQSEDTLMTAQQQLQQVGSRIDEVQQQIAEKTDKLQGTVLLQRQRTAVQSLMVEIQQMELRLGLLMHQLIRCKTQNS